MSETAQMAAEARKRVGKGPNRALRRQGRVPAIVYGGTAQPVAISLEAREVKRALDSGRFMATLYDLQLSGGRPVRALAREVQVDPLKGMPIHVDFLRIEKGAKVVVTVPVTFENEDAAPGISAGGVLSVVRYDVEVEAPADGIPTTISVDLAGYEINDTVHASKVNWPQGVTPTIDDRDFTIATIAPPTLTPEEEDAKAEAEAAAAEGAEAPEDATEAAESQAEDVKPAEETDEENRAG